jgi:sulfur relay (sulfurtransferase) DsrF/TusC family protein
MQAVAFIFAPASVAQAINLEPISANTENQVDSHGIRLFEDGQYALVADRRGGAVLCFDVSDPCVWCRRCPAGRPRAPIT